MNARVEPLRAGLAILTALGLVITLIMVFGAPALADGDDSSAACNAMTGNTNSTTITAPAGSVVSAICIKSGENSFGTLKHSDVITADGTYGDGFVVVGIGTGSVTVTASGQHDVSHLDYSLATATTAPPTTVPTTSTPTSTPTTSTPTTSTPTTSTPTTSTPTTSTPTTSTPTTSTPTTSTPTTAPSTSAPSTTVQGTGNIIVAKQVAQGDPQNVAFNFTTSGFSLADSSLAHGESASASVAAGGPYAVSESVLTGWEQVSATCDSTEEADDSTPADINVSPGETVTCTFVNQIPDDVLGTVITTVPDEVEGTTIEADELPFTGIDGDRLLALAVLLLAGGLVALGVKGRGEEG